MHQWRLFPLLHLPLLLLLSTQYDLNAASSIKETLELQAGVNPSLELIDPTLPPAIGAQPPKCSVLALSHEFADTVGAPPVSANFTQPDDCPAPWTRVVLELSISASDAQHHRIAAVWIDGAEILRASTPQPISPGAFWRTQKDVTRYTALLRRLADGGTLYMMLDNSNTTLPGVYSANLTLHFYRGPFSDAASPAAFRYTAHPAVKSLYREPADLIIPVSQPYATDGHGFCFRVDNDAHVPAALIAVPTNTYRAVIEIFASYHAADEAWYTTPVRSADGGGGTKGGFRLLYATIDGKFVGGHIPFAVIYPSSINPYFWSPVAAIGAFDLPSYDIDVTPFLSLLLDGGVHEIGLGVRDSQPYWLLTGNLHVWVDPFSDVVTAGLVEYKAPPLKLTREASWRDMDGSSDVEGEGLLQFIGWVSSSRGNLTTMVRQKVKFKSQVSVHGRGAVRQVEMTNKERTTVAVHNGNQLVGRALLYKEAPMQVQTSSVNAVGGAVFQKTRLSHQLVEEMNLLEGQESSISSLADRQDSEGSALLRDGKAVWGSGSTRSSYKYRDAGACYLRSVDTVAGMLKTDTGSASCAALADA